MSRMAGDGACYIAIRFIGSDEDLVLIGHSERLQVEEYMVFVGHFEADLGNVGEGCEDMVAHGIKRVLDGEAFMMGKAVEQIEADGFIGLVIVDGCAGDVFPFDLAFGGEDAVCGGFEGRVFVFDIMFEG